MIRYAFSLFFLLALTLGLTLSFMDSAFSISTSQQDCDFDVHATDSTSFVLVPNSSVKVNNGFLSRNCVISFIAEAGATAGDAVGIAYSIDGGTCEAFGPIAFHSGDIPETHTNISVANLGHGAHTIQPCFKLFDSGGSAVLADRCLIVECHTR